MFALLGVFVLLAMILIRPQEITPALRGIPFLYLGLGLAVFGFLIDLRLRLGRLWSGPHLPWVILFFAWCLLSVAIRNPAALASQGIGLAISIVIYLIIGHAVQTFRAFQVLVSALLGIALFLSLVGIHQGYAPLGCMEIDDSDNTRSAGKYDGRSCEIAEDCRKEGAEPGADYDCERLGLFGTFTIEEGTRVRYLGTMQDPNELALVIGVATPFAFALFERKRSLRRLLLLLASLVIIGTCIVLTRSRGGQLILIAAIAAYFIKRYGMRGLVLGAVLGSPLLMLGGRGGEKAESSSIERIECLYEGISMFKQYPLMGVGQGQFTEHHFLTAHNSYLLAAAELGLIGMLFWSVIIYLCVKVPVSAMRRFEGRPEAAVAQTWAMALLASFVGLLIGIFFLSYCYEYTLWIYIGLVSAFYCAAKNHDPDWNVRVSWKELLAIAVGDAALVGVLFVYSRLNAP